MLLNFIEDTSHRLISYQLAGLISVFILVLEQFVDGLDLFSKVKDFVGFIGAC